MPGLTFNASTRQLSGTPTVAGTHAITYTVTDEDGDTDTLTFTITVSESSGAGDSTSYAAGDVISDLPSGRGFPT